MTDLETFCHYTYKTHFIPIYILKDSVFISSFPEQTELTFPPTSYLNELLTSSADIALYITSHHTLWGRITVKDSSETLIVGPSSVLKYSRELLRSMYAEYQVLSIQQREFASFFQNIPTMTFAVFINLLLLMNYTVNHTVLTEKDIANYLEIQSDLNIQEKLTENLYKVKEYESFHDNLTLEQELLSYIENGDLEKLRTFIPKAQNTHVGVLAQNNLRQQKMYVLLH